MGAETLIALVALALAGVALVQVRKQSERSAAAPHIQSGPTNTDPRLEQLTSRVQSLEKRTLEHESLLCCLVTEDEARHLWNLAKDESTMYELHPGVEGELRGLVRRGLVSKRSSFNIHQLSSSFDIREHFELSPTGKKLLALRKPLEKSDMRQAESLPPTAPDASGSDRSLSFMRGTG